MFEGFWSKLEQSKGSIYNEGKRLFQERVLTPTNRNALQRARERVASGFEEAGTKLNNIYPNKLRPGPQTLGFMLAGSAAFVAGSIIYGVAYANEKAEAKAQRDYIKSLWQGDGNRDITYGGNKYTSNEDPDSALFSSTKNAIKAKVISIEDADTLKVSVEGKVRSIRLRGVDAPEIAHSHTVRFTDWFNPGKLLQNINKLSPQAMGLEAKAFTESLVKPGEEISLNLSSPGGTEQNLDRYKRLLAEVVSSKGVSLNKALIAEGLGNPYFTNPEYYDSSLMTPSVRALAYKALIEGKGIYKDKGYVLPSDYRHGNLVLPGVRHQQNLEAVQLANSSLPSTILEPMAGGSLLAPSEMGASYFYARALHNNLMRQAGLSDQVITNEDSGIATALYNMGHLATYGSLNKTPWEVQAYDKELLTSSLGARLNEAVMPLGIGRVYKEEVGFIPSAFGLLGKALDFGWLSAYGQPQAPISSKSEHYQAGREGFFETAFTNVSNLTMTAAQAVSFYLILNEPLNILFGQGVKSRTESALNAALTDEALSSTKASNIPKVIDRYIAVGSIKHRTPQEYRMNLAYKLYEAEEGINLNKARITEINDELRAIEQQVASTQLKTAPMKQKEAALLLEREDLTQGINKFRQQGKSFFGVGNFTPSLYHFNTLFLRERGALLAENVMEPFLRDVVNPFKLGSEADTNLKASIREYVSTLSSPAQLEMVNLTDTEMSDLHSYFRSKSIAEGKLPGDIQMANKALTDKEEYINSLLSKARYKISNVGQERSSSMAKALQGVLDNIPLSPTAWGIFQRRLSGGASSSKQVLALGDLLSFHEMSEGINKALFGNEGLTFLVEKYSNAYNLAKPTGSPLLDKLTGLWMAVTKGTVETLREVGREASLSRKVAEVQDRFMKMEAKMVPTGKLYISGTDGDTLKAASDYAQRELAAQGIPDTDPRYIPLKDSLQRAYVSKHRDLTIREVGDISDDAFYQAIQADRQFKAGLTSKESLLFEAKLLRGMHDRAEGLHLNTLQSSSKTVAGIKRLEAHIYKLRPGLGGDATSAITKSKFGTATLTVLASALLLDRAFSSTEGVSLITSTLTALAMGRDNKYGNVSFGGDRLIGDVFGVPGDLLLSLGVFLPLSIAAAKALDTPKMDVYGFSLGKVQPDLKPETLKSMPVSDTFTGNIRRTGENLYDVILPGEGNKLATGFELEGEFLTTKVVSRSGKTWRRAFSTWAGLTLATMFGTKALAGLLEASRSVTSAIHKEGQGTLDPILGFGLGATIGAIGARSLGRRVTAGIAFGAILGSIGGLFTQFSRVGRPGEVADALKGTMVSELTAYAKTVEQRIAEGKTSKLELMAAFYARSMAGMSGVTEGGTGGKETRVVAKQVTMPMLQFFLSESSKGIYYDSEGKAIGQGVKYYSFGIQGPPITGTSLVFQAPFKIRSSGTGLFGLGISENDQFDIGDLYAQMAGVAGTVYASTFALQSLAYTSTKLTRKVLPSTPFKTGVLPEIVKATDILTDALAHIGSLGMKLGVNLTVGEISLTQGAFKGRTARGALMKGLVWSTALSQIGGAIGGALTAPELDPESDTLQSNILLGQSIGALSGVGAALAFHYKGAEVSSFALKGLSKLAPKQSRFAAATALSAAYAIMQTDSGYGTTIGMDEDILQRGITVGLYSLTGAYLFGQVSGLGRSVGDTFSEYSKLKGQLSSLTGDSYLESVKRALLERRIASLENELDTVISVSQHLSYKVESQTSNRLKAVVTEISALGKDITPRDLSPEVLERLSKYGRGLGVKAGFLTSALTTRRLVRSGMVGASLVAIGAIAANILPTETNNLYESLDSMGTPGLKQLAGGVADFLRLLTHTDYTASNTTKFERVYRGGDMPEVMRYRKLRGANSDPLSQVAWKDINRILVVDNPNVFVSMFNITGLTFSPGEKGSRSRQYFQIQGPGADVSTAAYGMASAFMFQEALQGNRELAMLVTTSMREMNEALKEGRTINQGTLRRVARRLLSVTERLQPVKVSRKFSRASGSELDAAAKDPLLMEMLETKDRYLQSLSYAPPASIVGRFVKVGMQAHDPKLAQNLMRFLLGDTSVTHSLYSDAFGLTGRDLTISGILVGPGGKPGAGTDTGDWLEESQYVTKDKSPPPSVNPFQAVTSIIPGPIGLGVSLIGAAALGTYLLASLGSLSSYVEQSALEKRVESFYKGSGQGWFRGEDGKAAFRFKHLTNATGSKVIAMGEEVTALLKGNYFLGVDTKQLKSLITSITGSPSAQWEAFFNAFARLQEQLDEALLSTGFDATKYGGFAPSKGNLYQRMTDPTYLKGAASRIEPVLSLIDGKQVVIDRAGFISRLSLELQKPVDDIIESFFFTLEKADLGSGREGAFLRLATGDESVSTLEDLSKWAERRGRPLLGKEGLTVREVFKDEVGDAIKTVLERELTQGGKVELSRILQYSSTDLEEVIRYLSIKVQAELMSSKSPISLMRHSFGGLLQPLNVSLLDKVEASLGNALRSGTNPFSGAAKPKKANRVASSVSPGAIAPEGAEVAKQVGKVRMAQGNLKATAKAVGKGLHTAWRILGTAFDVIEGLDLFSSISRAGESYADKSFSAGERIRLTNEAGGVVATSITAMAVIGGLVKLVPMAIGAISTLVTGAAAAVGVTITLPVAIAVAVAALAVGTIGYFLDQKLLGGRVSSAIGTAASFVGKGLMWGANKLFEWGGKLFNWAGDTIGAGFRLMGDAATTVLGDNAVGRRTASGLIMGVGGLLTAGAIGVGLLIGGAIALPVLGAMALGGLLVGALLGAAAPSLVESIFTTITNFIGKGTKDLPVLGSLTSMPGQWIHQRFQPIPESPFFMGTAQEALEAEWAKALKASSDPTGRAAAGMLVDYSLINQGFQNSRSANESGYSIRPGGVIDPFIQSELALRGQYYNQSVIGRGLWKTIYKDAINKNDIKQYARVEEEYAKVALSAALKAARDRRLSKSVAVSKKDGVNLQALGMLAASLNNLVKGIPEKQVTAKVQVKAPVNLATAQVKGEDTRYTPTQNAVEVKSGKVSVKRTIREDAPIWHDRHDEMLDMNPCRTQIA